LCALITTIRAKFRISWSGRMMTISGPITLIGGLSIVTRQ
jgi:hypothetical protein